MAVTLGGLTGEIGHYRGGLNKPGMVAMANLAKKFLRCVYGAWKSGQALGPGLVAKTPKGKENK